ncbi:MAG TPA: oligosaccharide flippase family protein [Acidimicrobiales bacterium]|nr:oligosaccharide flippase family protein [Acidimicrobiales bacterium]
MPRALPRLTRNSGMAFFAALTYFNLSTFGFHVIVSRLLGPARYGALGAILALAALSGNGTGAVSAAATRAVAVGGAARAWDTRRVRRVGLIAAGAAVVVVCALAPLLERYLHLTSPVPLLLFALLAAATLAGMVPRGILLGRRRFAPVSAALACGVTTKLAVGAVLAHTAGISGAMTGAALGECVTAVLCFRAERAAPGNHGDGSELSVPVRSFSLATGAYWGFWLLTATDTFLARHLLGATASGLYVAASTAASIALFLPNNITLAAFPSLAGAAADGGGPPGTFRRPFTAAAVLTVAAAGGLALMPGLVVEVLFGSGFKHSAPLLVLLCVSNGSQGMVSFLMHHQLAHHKATCLLPWVAILVLVPVVYAAHSSGSQIATEDVFVSASLLGAMGLISLRLLVPRGTPAPDVAPLPFEVVAE